MEVFSTFTSQVPGIPNEASRKEDKIIVKNMTLWKMSRDNSVVTGVFFNSIRYKIASLFPAVIHCTLAPQMNGVGTLPARVSFIISV